MGPMWVSWSLLNTSFFPQNRLPREFIEAHTVIHISVSIRAVMNTDSGCDKAHLPTHCMFRNLNLFLLKEN